MRSESSNRDASPYDLPANTTVWVYLRHSDSDGQTLDSQEEAVMQLIHNKKWIVDRIFRDRWASGTSTRNREEFEEMRYFALQIPRPADLLIVWDYSRFARNLKDAQFYRAEFRHHGWQVLSMNDEIPAGDFGPVIEAWIDWKNERFIRDLREATRRGLRYIASRGCVPGGPILIGYTHRPVQIGIHRDGEARMGRKPEPDPEVASRVVRAFHLKAEGAPYTAIAAETGLYSPTSSSWDTFFRNRAYVGEFVYQGEIYENVYPPLISQELFDAVQQTLPVRNARRFVGRTHSRRRGSSYFIANIALCAYCGAAMEGVSSGGYRYYICSQRHESADLCPESSLIPAQVEQQLLDVLCKHVITPDRLTELLDWTNGQLNDQWKDLELRTRTLRAQLENERRVARLMAHNFLIMPTPTEAALEDIGEHDKLVKQLDTALQTLERRLAESRIDVSPDEIEQYSTRATAMIDRAEFYDLRALCEELCSRIVMSNDKCIVELHFPAPSVMRAFGNGHE